MGAHVLADLAFQAAAREQPSDAVELGETAAHMAAKMPATVRASVGTRLAYAYAIAHQLSDFDHAHQTALDTLEDRRDGEEPPWMYFLTPNHLDTQAGYALIHAGTLAQDSNDRTTARALLRRGDRLLRTGVHGIALDESSSQRRALFEGAWSAVAAASRGDLEGACSRGRLAVTRTETVQSPRSLEVLHTLASRLRRRTRNAHVADFLPILEATLARQPTRV
jgi:hypothetical protein